MLQLLLYFVFVHFVLLVPAFVVIKNLKFLSGKPGIELCATYLLSILLLAGFAVVGYAVDISRFWLHSVPWVLISFGVYFFIKQKLYRDLWQYKIPLAALIVMSLFSCAFISLQLAGPRPFFPDPEFQVQNNYQAFNVKVLNVAQTPANDNYVPYRQAQFMVNHADIRTTSFIDEWGVHFFQRTPLMGAATAEFFTLLGDTPPLQYTWSPGVQDPNKTYIKFQIIGQIMNSLFVLPAYFILARLFNRKTALASLLFIIPSAYFLFNSFFTWPKSLVAFFVLFSWILILEKRLRYLLLAGVASGTAYLTHDLAVLYIGASVLLLLYSKRFRDTLIFIGINILFFLPWFIVSAIIYKKPSTFIYYPFSIHGIPQVEQKDAIIKEFFATSPLKIIAIKLQSLAYLLTPYQLIVDESGQEFARRMWACTLFNVPGAMGLGLLWAGIVGAFQKIRDITFWILAVVPIILCTIIIGWPMGMGALHFAEASVVLCIGLAVWFLLKLKNPLWILIAYIVNCAQLVIFALYSYNNQFAAWFTSKQDMLALAVLIAVIVGCGWLLPKVARSKETRKPKIA